MRGAHTQGGGAHSINCEGSYCTFAHSHIHIVNMSLPSRIATVFFSFSPFLECVILSYTYELCVYQEPPRKIG